MATEVEPRISPRQVVRSGLCIGCGSCVGQSGAPIVAMAMDRYGLLTPRGPSAWLDARSTHLARTCPFSPAARDEDQLAAELYPDARHRGSVGRFLAAYVGHVAEGELRTNGSSGGMVSWVLVELLRRGVVDAVAHVVPIADPPTDGRFFRYRISRTEQEVRAGAKSRYYPIELSETLRTIRSTPGRYAIVGVPCFVKAVQLLRREDPIIRERVVVTLGLFCGHMKSARFVESFAWQLGVPLEDVREVDYRVKHEGRPASWYRARLTRPDGNVAEQDWWHLVDGDWGAGFFQSPACNACDDVIAETADVSFGDAWVEPYSSAPWGTNVVVVRSPVVAGLIEGGIHDGRLQLDPVDAGFVERTQAAGFRQRREGLAYRLTWARPGIQPRKRVAPDAHQPPRRKLIYRMRAHISAWSHRVAWLAHATGQPRIYTAWARAVLSLYHGLAYSRGRLGRLIDWLGLIG